MRFKSPTEFSHFFPPLSSQNIATVTLPHQPSEGEPVSPENLKEGSALFRNAKVTIQVFHPYTDTHTQKKIGPKCYSVPSKRHSCPHTPQLSYSPFLILKNSWLCQISSPSFTLSRSLFLSRNSFTFSATALISSLQFPFHFLSFKLQVSLMLTTSSLSAFKQRPPLAPHTLPLSLLHHPTPSW